MVLPVFRPRTDMRWIAVLLAALLLLLASPLRLAYAQSVPAPPATKPTPAEEATAKRNFESGLRLYNEGSYAEALIAFEQSYRVGGRPSALKNIAQCHRNLKHFVEAYDAYEEMLARHDAQISAGDKKAVQQALDELGVLTATVIVDASEPYASIEIDGKSAGKSPMTKPKRIAATGVHTLRVTKPGFAPFEQTFTVDSQQNKKIDAKLEVEKTVGRVVVREQNGRDVHVLVDGQDKGPAPWEGVVAAGEHTIEAKSARFASEARKVVVAVKERLDLALDAAPLQGRLRVTTVPATATIAIDGNTVGTGAWEGELPEGPHRIEVSLPGQTPQQRDIVLGRGQLVVQEIPLVSAIATSRAPVYEGLYGRFSLFGHVNTSGAVDNSVDPFTRTDGGGFSGHFGATLRIGRAWDWWGAEVVGLFGIGPNGRDYTYVVPISTGGTSTQSFGDQGAAFHGFIGVGPRVTSKDDSVRFTFGIAPGIGIHSYAPRRAQNVGNGDKSPTNNNPGDGSQQRFAPQPTNQQNTSGFSEEEFKAAGYNAFGFLMDGGILLGSTPGTKFYLGVQAWLDFAPTLATGPDTRTPIPNEAFKSPGRGILLVDGTQFYVGPTLGLQFGH
jgi:hypothetical protein